MPTGDTIAAIASPPGRSARGMMRLSGPATREVLAAVLVEPPRPFERGCFRSRLRVGEGVLPVLVATYRGPSSYTGEDSAELLLPGNPVLLELILQALLSVPTVRQAGPGEFTARAYLNERLTLSEAEGVAATIAAEGEAQLAGARALLDGRTGAAYRAWAEEVATLLALVEAGIDFTDQEDVVAISATELTERVASLIGQIEEYVGAGAGAGVRSETPRVVIAGKPNAGKSTLFNALLGRRRAVVSEVAGTTRDVLEEPLDLSRDLPGAGCVTLMDLAGLDAGAAGIDAAAQAAAEHAIAEADAVLHCDPAGVFGALPVGPSKPVIRVRTKGDLLAGAVDGDAISVCALDGWNLPVLRRAIADVTTGSTGGSAAAVLPRHRRALAVARASLTDAMEAGGPELAAAGLRGALDALGELVGRISPDDVIGRIFATFCVGK